MVLSHRAKCQLIINFFRVKATYTGLLLEKLFLSFHRLLRAGQRCFELLALIGSPQLSFQRYSQLNKHLGLTGKPYWLAERQMLSRE